MIAISRLYFDGIELADVIERLVCNQAFVCRMQIKKFAPDMRQASQFDTAARFKQGFVTPIVIDHQRAVESVEESLGIPPGAAHLEIKHDGLLW